jgi:hypothetical protein
VASLVPKDSGREMLNRSHGAFPRFTGRPNPNLSTRPNPPAFYDSQKSKAQIDWLAKGPLWATVRAQHAWPYLKFETRVTLAAGRPYVEAVVRVLAQVPPKTDDNPPDIKEGYWLSFAPGFPVTRILRDFPLGAEETKNPAFHALTWVDLAGADRSLLLLHPGTQYFRNEADGRVSNLIMREWESHFTGEFGWPSYAEYRYGLWPHAGALTNGDRLRAAAEFCRPLDCALREPQPGAAPASRGFLGTDGKGFELSAFRGLAGGGYELRVVETEGRGAEGGVRIDLPLRGAARTDLVGNRLGDARLEDGRLAVSAGRWKIVSFRLD